MMMLEIQQSAILSNDMIFSPQFTTCIKHSVNETALQKGWYIIMGSNKTAFTHLGHADFSLFSIYSNAPYATK